MRCPASKGTVVEYPNTTNLGPPDANATKGVADAYIPPPSNLITTPANAPLRVRIDPNPKSNSVVDRLQAATDLAGPGVVVRFDHQGKGAMNIKTDIEVGTPAARIWQKIVATLRSRGQTDEELFKKVNVGFTEDPQRRPLDYNQRICPSGILSRPGP